MSIKVVGLGLGRTGTLSLKQALEQLGFGPCYHMDTLLRQPDVVGCWSELDRTGTTDWNTLFGRFGSAVDFPTIAYHPAILKQYPEAKCILTVRDEEDWYRSARATILQAEPSLREKIFLSLKLPFSRRHRRLLEVFQLTGKFWDLGEDKDEAIGFLRGWNEGIRASIPPERLLVYDVRDGWAPLCNFLGVPLPDRPFPRSNDKADFRTKYRELMGVD